MIATASPFSAALRRHAFANALWPLARQGAWWLAATVFSLHTAFGTHNNQSVASLLIGITMSIGCLVWAVILSSRLRELFEHGKHPVDKELLSTPAAPIPIADLDTSFAGQRYRLSGLNVSADYVVMVGHGQLMIRRLEDMMWAYPDQATRSFIGRTTQNLTVWDRAGKGFTAPMSRDELVDALNLLSIAAPWLPMGMNDVKNDSWNADRAEFIAYVDEHRARLRGY